MNYPKRNVLNLISAGTPMSKEHIVNMLNQLIYNIWDHLIYFKYYLSYYKNL